MQRVCVDIFVNPEIASGVDNVEKLSFCMRVAATLKLVLFSVEWLPPVDGIWWCCNPQFTI
jgi:hypothetical protein